MIDARLQKALNAAGLTSAPAVTRFYGDGAGYSGMPSVVVQRDMQGIRVMLRNPEGPDGAWTSAWFNDDGEMLSVEKFSTGEKPLDLSLADDFLASLAAQPLAEMANESQRLGG